MLMSYFDAFCILSLINMSFKLSVVSLEAYVSLVALWKFYCYSNHFLSSLFNSLILQEFTYTHTVHRILCDSD